jgi:thiol:disulfide interchange protein DsbD
LRTVRLARLVVIATLLTLAGIAFAAPVKTAQVEAELIAEKTALVPGQPTTVALRLKIAKGWHTYWRNPGDTGLPTTLAWTLPSGVAASAIEWPAPHALPVGPLVNYGYESEALHLVTLTTVPEFAPGREATLAAKAEWLVCRETCFPQGAELTLTLPVANTAGPDPRFGKAIAATRAALPQPLVGWQVTAEGAGAKVVVALTPPAGAGDPGTLHFFPYEEGRIEASVPQVFKRDGDAYLLTLPVASQLAPGFTRVAGVITATNGLADVGGLQRAAIVDVPLTGSVIAGPKLVLATPALNVGAEGFGAGGLSLGLAVLFAFLGGIVLNLMPCVFPVLSLKVMGFVAHQDSKATLHREAGAFAAGVVLTFVALGVALLSLRATGEQLGWGFQLQSPGVITALALLFCVLALNLSGVFEFGQLAPAAIRGWTSQNRTLDAFGSGILAVIVASPCTAPFMGAALGYAMVQNTSATVTVFAALGAGMALPYVLLAWFPGWRRRLPKPGAWMVRFKQFLAFPLYATVAWLAWVLGVQLDNDAVLRLLATLVAVAFALWAWQAFQMRGARAWSVAALVGVIAAAIVGRPLMLLEAPVVDAATVRGPVAATDPWQP